jgi:hypothetical protein
MISMGTSSVPDEDVFPKPNYGDLRCSQVLPGMFSALPDLSPAVPGVPKVLSGAPRCSQTY